MCTYFILVSYMNIITFDSTKDNNIDSYIGTYIACHSIDRGSMYVLAKIEKKNGILFMTYEHPKYTFKGFIESKSNKLYIYLRGKDNNNNKNEFIILNSVEGKEIVQLYGVNAGTSQYDFPMATEIVFLKIGSKEIFNDLTNNSELFELRFKSACSEIKSEIFEPNFHVVTSRYLNHIYCDLDNIIIEDQKYDITKFTKSNCDCYKDLKLAILENVGCIKRGNCIFWRKNICLPLPNEPQIIKKYSS